MFRNLTNLRTELRSRGKINTTALSNTRLTAFLNEAQDDVSNEFDFSHLYVEETLTTTANSRILYTKFSYNKIELISDVTANNPLFLENEDTIREQDPEMSQVGAPWVYSIWGYSYVRNQPSAASVVTLVSSSASDSNVNVTVQGISGGVEQTEVINTNGVTPIAGTVSFTELFSIVSDGTHVGTLTATTNAGGVTAAIIGPNGPTDEKQPIYLWPTPTDARSIHVRGYRRPRTMIVDGDFPDLPSNYHELVLIGALIRSHKDLLRFSLADKVLQAEFIPKLEQLKKEDKNSRTNRAPVKGGSSGLFEPIGRYPSNFSVYSNGRW